MFFNIHNLFEFIKVKKKEQSLSRRKCLVFHKLSTIKNLLCKIWEHLMGGISTVIHKFWAAVMRFYKIWKREAYKKCYFLYFWIVHCLDVFYYTCKFLLIVFLVVQNTLQNQKVFSLYEGWNFNFGNTPLDWIQELLEWRANAAGRTGPSPTYIHNGSSPSRNGHTQ